MLPAAYRASKLKPVLRSIKNYPPWFHLANITGKRFFRVVHCRRLLCFFAHVSAHTHSYSDHWTYITQRLIFLIALVIYLEAGFLVTRETAAEMLGCE